MRQNLGITLIELMITMAVLAIITAIAIPAYSGYIASGYRAECQTELAAIALAQEEFFLQNNTYVVGNMNFGTDVGLIAALNGLYAPSGQANSANSNCSYAVAAGTTGSIASSYRITATGRNNLPNTVSIIKDK